MWLTNVNKSFKIWNQWHNLPGKFVSISGTSLTSNLSLMDTLLPEFSVAGDFLRAGEALSSLSFLDSVIIPTPLGYVACHQNILQKIIYKKFT